MQIGTMQGRLLPKYKGRYQAFPPKHWQDEFTIAASLGLNLIEFILDYEDADANPLLHPDGPAQIAAVIRRTDVAVHTICADYFMEAPLHAANLAVAAQSLKVLETLIVNAAQLGMHDVVIPCVDQSSLRGEADMDRFITALSQALPLATRHQINLALETDLAPQPFVTLLQRLNSPAVTVNYDTGNSAALGFDPAEELAAYGTRITDIHIKDRTLGGGPVLLGEGHCRFNHFFKALAKTNYGGPFIMQAWRDEEGVAVFKQQLAFILPYIQQHHSERAS